MDNIDLLLASLDSKAAENTAEETDIFTDTFEEKNTACNISFENDKGTLSKDREIETVKKSVSKKYSEYGYEIHKQLKEKAKTSEDRFEKNSATWKTQPTESQRKDTLTVTQTAGKNDVCAEPIFGLRLINPVVSSQVIQTKMVGRTPITLARLQNHLSCGDKNTDWVFAGAIVFKSGLRTSQKGSQYCFWKISDLKNDLKQVTLYLFGKAGSELWKLALGTVVAVLNASSMNKDEIASKDEITLSVRNADQVMIWGMSRDYGICKAKKKNGENCTSFVNKSLCEFCIYHVKSEYNKYTGKRFDLQASYSNGLTELRNKVLGKNEVFYGGKSFTALKPPPKINKQREKDNSILNYLSKKSSTVEQFKNQSKSATSDQRTLDKLKENLPDSEKSYKNNYKCEKPLVSARMNVFKEAGKKLLQTGEVTRITAVNLEKRKTFVSFATVFNPEKTDSSKVDKNSNKNSGNFFKINENPRSPLDKKEEPSFSVALKLCKEVVLDFDFDDPLIKKPSITKKCGETFNKSKTASSTDDNQSKSTLKSESKSTCSLKSMSPPTNQLNNHVPVDSRQAGDFLKTRMRSHEEHRAAQSSDSKKETKLKTKLDRDSPQLVSLSSKNRINNHETVHSEQDNEFLKTKMRSFENHRAAQAAQVSDSIHQKKRDQAKMNAIRLIQRKGGLSKVNPNQVKAVNDDKRTVAVKRALEISEEGDGGSDEISEIASLKKSVLSQRFVDLMNAQSKHENLAQLAADMEEQNYFNKMEKKEQLEEKMLTTYKVACKAVSCLKCKYKWFSASDLCKAEGHPIKVIDAVKRFFKCQNCSNRTISLEIVPLISCKNCGSSKWTRAPMIKEKICQNNSTLSIRGDEVKFLDSFGQKQNLNLLVPE